MDPITVLSIITVTGIILLLGLFGACFGYMYLTVRAESAQEAHRRKAGDQSAGKSGAGATGDFVFGTDDESTGDADPRQQL